MAGWSPELHGGKLRARNCLRLEKNNRKFIAWERIEI